MGRHFAAVLSILRVNCRGFGICILDTFCITMFGRICLLLTCVVLVCVTF